MTGGGAHAGPPPPDTARRVEARAGGGPPGQGDTGGRTREPPAALLVHDGPGRMRLRLPALRGDAPRLAALALALAGLPGVVAAESAALTGSVLVLHRAESAGLLRAAEAAGLLRLTEEAPPVEGPSLSPAVFWPAVGAAAVALLALHQLLQRQVLPPAFSLATQALVLARAAWAAQHGEAAPLAEDAPDLPG
ncbi:hypothetical protein [Rubritepida flocculans]|uniref:hypothetical protein n=1 Tax=Rubritepida flocculans TaxID=182403 RepID=UPI0012EB1911|nr:hypothetical protein [Rubritepida flocculans]